MASSSPVVTPGRTLRRIASIASATTFPAARIAASSSGVSIDIDVRERAGGWTPDRQAATREMRTENEMVLAHFIVSDDVERSRRFYTDVLGGKTVIGGEAGDAVTYVALANSWGIINESGGANDHTPRV